MQKETYWQKYHFCERHLPICINENLGLIVVIPCFNENNLLRSLNSLKNCQKTETNVEVIVVVNASEKSSLSIKQQNEKTYQSIIDFQRKNDLDWISFYGIFENNLPKKHAGVGLARKIGMDEAVLHFSDIDNEDGVIVCFDADSQCDKNYLVEIEKHFKLNPNTPGCSIKYEHPLEGEEFGNEIYKAIIDYELFLRYYKNALHYTGHPYYYYTVGSSMAVKKQAYEKQGGMNRRKAGEDFYFLQKIIQLGNFTEINSSRVVPSPRISDRVPFGTGKAVGEISTEEKEYTSYDFQSFKDLRLFFSDVELFFNNDNPLLDKYSKSIQDFFGENFKEEIAEINRNAKNLISFKKRFYNYYNAFQVLKYVHFARDNFYPNKPIQFVVADLFPNFNGLSKKEMLLKLRKENL